MRHNFVFQTDPLLNTLLADCAYNVYYKCSTILILNILHSQRLLFYSLAYNRKVSICDGH